MDFSYIFYANYITKEFPEIHVSTYRKSTEITQQTDRLHNRPRRAVYIILLMSLAMLQNRYSRIF